MKVAAPLVAGALVIAIVGLWRWGRRRPTGLKNGAWGNKQVVAFFPHNVLQPDREIRTEDLANTCLLVPRQFSHTCPLTAARTALHLAYYSVCSGGSTQV
jgi:hypothetical protein